MDAPRLICELFAGTYPVYTQFVGINYRKRQESAALGCPVLCPEILSGGFRHFWRKPHRPYVITKLVCIERCTNSGDSGAPSEQNEFDEQLPILCWGAGELVSIVSLCSGIGPGNTPSS